MSTMIARIGASVGVGALGLASLQTNDSLNNMLSRVFNIMGAFQKSPQIKDPYTSLKHENSLALLTQTSPPIFQYSTRFMPETSEQAQNKIVQGKYIRCPSVFQLPSQSMDVIITGTTEPKICNQFLHDALKDLAVRAANEPLNSEHPCAEIPVFERSETGVRQAGNLTNMPSTTRAHLAGANFKVCPNYCGKKVIIAGDTHRTACHDLFRQAQLGLISTL